MKLFIIIQLEEKIAKEKLRVAHKIIQDKMLPNNVSILINVKLFTRLKRKSNFRHLLRFVYELHRYFSNRNQKEITCSKTFVIKTMNQA